MEHQILRTEMPDPTRTVYGPPGTRVHYFHAETYEYLGTEQYLAGADGIVLEAHRHEYPPTCTIEVCHCSQCLTNHARNVSQQYVDDTKAMHSWQRDALAVFGEVETFARMQLNSDGIVDCEIVGRRLLEILGDRWTRQQ